VDRIYRESMADRANHALFRMERPETNHLNCSVKSRYRCANFWTDRRSRRLDGRLPRL